MPFFRQKPATVETCTITEEMVKYHRKKLSAMKSNKTAATVMHLRTKATVYKLSIKTIDDCIKTAKKVLKLGTRTYKVGGKTARLLEEFNAAVKTFEIVAYQIQLKIFPKQAEDTMLDWMTKDEEDTRFEEKTKEVQEALKTFKF